MAFFKIDRSDPRVIEGSSSSPCNCSRFVWQITSVVNGDVVAEREVCLNCKTPNGNTR